MKKVRFSGVDWKNEVAKSNRRQIQEKARREAKIEAKIAKRKRRKELQECK